jgi:hypothetical protein
MTTFPSDPEFLKAAETCSTYSQLWKAFPEVRDFQAIRATAKRLNIKLDIVRKDRAGKPREAQPVPKPTGKSKPPAKAGGGDG